MRIFEDSRGWQYTVRPGLGQETYSVFYRKPGKSWHSVRVVPWRAREEESENDLIEYATKHKMRLVHGENENDR